MPPTPENITAEETKKCELVFAGAGVRKHLKLSMGSNKNLHINFTLTIPTGVGPFPTILTNRIVSENSCIHPGNLESGLLRGYLIAEY